MNILQLVLVALFDIAVTLALTKFVFRGLVAGWQRWGSVIYAVTLGGFYFELISGHGFVVFSLDNLTLVEYVSLVVFSLGMMAFHFAVLKIW
ncbi:hypothetical protein P5705_19315 [Pseudomonas entomophila]|uniref:hypothetical protein n=1 Tax=Pseudomonas entomophila TaxID=312306 RepID=UPI002406F4ED|nr:hypothetical protein [Pseudomonas entomophila]MDF9619803.1 hypothetical protein [Pseudomonas entomophila]